jgi:hypothetical protein
VTTSAVIGRGLWYVLAAFLGVLAIGNGLDRQSRRNASLDTHVPAPFRGFAQEGIAKTVIASGDAQLAVAETEKLIRQRPIPAESLLLLALAHDLSGDPETADKALELGAQRGWRIPQIQLVMIRASLNAGLEDGAAARLLAMWSVDTNTPMLELATREVFATPHGPEAFGAILAKSHFAQTSVLRTAARYTEPAAFARMIDSARRHGAAFDCGTLRTVAASFERVGAVSEARGLLGSDCGG